MILPALPGVTILVVRIVIGLFAPVRGGDSFSHSSEDKTDSGAHTCVCVSSVPAPPCSADTGMVLIMVVPGFEVAGVTPRMVDLADADAACALLRMVVCLPSADVTSFKMVPAGRAPFA